ncbi:MAG: pyruvate dehydrogenase complex dihydrolipoamide acetyltransferase [Deltaproteobacteria bacterium]|nr:pyruvate dehydrogenase complex dihydrolipoamide acetyltransferase [Deltaproteobacteria bacterium]
MAKILDMPKLSPTMEEGVLQTWHKNEGDSVNVDDLLAEVETDKATMEFRAFDKGTLLKILVPAGSNVKLGQPVAILGEKGEDVSALASQAGGGGDAPKADSKKEEPKPDTQPEAAEAAKADAAQAGRSSAGRDTLRPPQADAPPPRAPKPKGSILTRTEMAPDADESTAAANGRVLASPYVRKIARERGIELAGATGSGEHGRIMPEDLESMASRSRALSAPQDQARPQGQPSRALATVGLAEPEVRPLSPMRKTIARRLSESKKTVPHFYLTIDVDAEDLVALREKVNAEIADPKAEKPLKVSLNDLVIKAVAGALVRVPECNAQFTDDAILVHRRVDISVAVAIPDGLVTPVVRNADQKSVVAIAKEVRDLASRARAKKLKPEEMSDGTFSISNLGMFGIDEFSAVINPPEGAILAIGQARDVPVVKDGMVRPGKKMSMTLSCDHRVIDGAVGAAFLAELRALLEHPMRILTG